MSAIFQSSARAGGMMRRSAADVVVDDLTHRTTKDRKHLQPGRMATERELVECAINKTDDDYFIRLRLHFIREVRSYVENMLVNEAIDEH